MNETGDTMTERALFITTYDDETATRTLWFREPGDRDFFRWGDITDMQFRQLWSGGVFGLTGPDSDE